MDEKLNALHEMCETISREIEDANEKIRMGGGKLSAGDIDYVDKLTHALKSLKTTIAMMEADDGYSNRYDGRSYNDGMSDGRSYNDRSYARGRGRNANRYMDGRYAPRGYSYADGMDSVLEEMRGMMADLPADKQREVRQFIEKMER